MEQHIREMSSAMQCRVQSQRDWVRGHFVPGSEWKYSSIDGKLYLLEGILSKGLVEADETWKLQSLGITFGDALAERLHLNWVEVEDEYGIDPALRYGSSSVLAFPLTMISKRIGRGDTVDVRELFDGVAEMLAETIAKSS